MEKIDYEKKNMISDTFIYLVAKFVEGIIGIFTLSRYTYYFSETAYGSYIRLNVTVQIVSAFSTMWLAQSMYRFYKKYEDDDKMNEFYSTSFAIWFVINFALSMLSFSLIGFAFSIGANGYSPLVLIMAVFSFVAFNTQNILTTTLASSRKTKFNLFLSVFSAFGKLFMITILVTFFENNIILIFISNTVIDTLVSIFSVFRLKIYKFIKSKYISGEIFTEFLSYGTPFLGSLITTTLINNSDRYIISTQYLAIYATNYTVVSTLFTMLNTGIARGSVPTIYAVYARGEEKEAYTLVSQLVKYYLIIAIPLVCGIFMISKELSTFLFEPGYAKAHMVMFFVALGLMFSFLTECSNKAFELSKNTKYIFRNSLIGGLTNLILNLIFVPKYGYMVAGYTTLIGFLVYFILSKSVSVKYFKFNLGTAFYVKTIGTALCMSIIIWFLKNNYGTSLPNMLIYIIIAIVFYFSVLYLNGTLKDEINGVVKIIQNRFKKRGNF